MENIKYKDSGVDWIGDIPAHWEVKKLGDVISMNKDSLKNSTNQSFEFDYVDIGSVNAVDGIAKREHTTFGDAPSRARRIVHNNDTIMSTIRPYLKAIAFIDDAKDLVVSTGFAVMTPIKMSPRFLYWTVMSNSIIARAIKESNGIAYPAINASQLIEFEVAVPPLSEQEAIAAKLDAVITELDSVVANSEKIVTELKAYKSAVITEFITGQKLVPGFNNAERERVSSNIPWIGMIPSDWKVVKADNMFNRSKERGNNKNLVMLTVSKNYGVIAQDEFNGAMKNKEGTDLSNLRTIHAGDHIISLMSFEGGIETSDIEGVCSPAYIVFRDSKKFSLDNHYFKWMFKSSGFVKALSSLAQGIRNGKTIKYDSFKEMSLMVPPLTEQQAISNFLDSETSKIDTQINYYQSLITEMKSFKQAIISEAVTGKLN